ncbi:MAG TPA: DMT family transporter [Chloroflexia bacterium]|nr:DMT family transporter [Chloroflexia bacterium]
MSLKELGVLVALGAIWGASFMFIKVGGSEIEPFAFVEIRLALAALVMLVISAARKGTLAEIRKRWLPLTIMGLINCALPYTLITWGEVFINSGLASIYNACAPLWAGALLLFIPSSEKTTVGRLVGLLVGFAGVSLVVSSNLHIGTESVWQWLGQGACLLAALSYAFAGIYGRYALKGVPVQVSATGQLVSGTLMLMPLAAFQLPQQVPSWQAIGSVVTLAIAGTALASLMYYWLLVRVGATGTLLVTYLLPVFALIWGALLLHESITLLALLGLVLVLMGIGISSGTGANLLAWMQHRRQGSVASSE